VTAVLPRRSYAALTGSADRFCAYQRPVAPTDVEPIDGLVPSDRATVEGEVHTLQIQPVDHRIGLHGTAGRQSDGRLTMVNPTYELMTASV
jgi:hypothetical protein